MKKALTSILVSTAMVIGPLPALSADSRPLAPGGAAGIQRAQGNDTWCGQAATNDNKDPCFIWLVGAGVVVGLGILLLSNNNDSNSPLPTVPVPVA